MLNIRVEQMRVFERAIDLRFAEEIYPEISARWQKVLQEIGEDAMRARLLGAIRDARQFGIITKNHQARFANIHFAIGPSFPSQQDTPWALEILQRKELSPQSHLDLLVNHAANQILSKLIKLVEEEN